LHALGTDIQKALADLLNGFLTGDYGNFCDQSARTWRPKQSAAQQDKHLYWPNEIDVL
jgi:hypothetical protein